jgi:hypothetical protein
MLLGEEQLLSYKNSENMLLYTMDPLKSKIIIITPEKYTYYMYGAAIN